MASIIKRYRKKRANLKRKKENTLSKVAGGLAGAAIGGYAGSKLSGLRKKKGLKNKISRVRKKARGATIGATVGAAVGAAAGRGVLGASRIEAKAKKLGKRAYVMTAAHKKAISDALKGKKRRKR